MKIAVVHSFYSGAVPSGENNVVEMQVEALRSSGHEVELVDVRTDQLSDKPLYKLRTAVNIISGGGESPLERLNNFSPDVVHVHNLFPNYSTHWLGTWDGPLVATIHNFRPVCAAATLFRDGQTCTKCPQSGHHNAVIHACYKDSKIATLPLAIRSSRGLTHDPVLSRADELVFLSDRALRTYRELGLSPENCTIIPNFVSGDKRTGTPGAGKHWIYAGRLTQEKGITDLLRNWPSDELLSVFGDGPCLEEAMDLAGSNVTFSGNVPRAVLLSELSAAKGLVLPSSWAEGLPTIYLEALAAALPVVARAGNSAADDISLHEHGVVYSDPEDVKEAVQVVNDGRELFAEQSLARYKQAYTPDAWVDGVVAVYQKAIRTRKRTDYATRH
ncbi:glycosyltransferase family 4 protein [Arthrobacter sp. Rue61a]|uniref:glycosyltransferase family 4 protein n=1 Tax=Arthrobacter sp. Rue61a TaxID=1118963 RepID=UPI00027DF3FA|nr:glycosyltransferase family 4 protein [Arthrobacter sp. Rue61a]AFR30191.1 putative glycosyltransferase [Arthrobacter sp. Rue61a]